MPEPRRADAEIMLRVTGLNVYYGRSHALQGVDLTLAHGVLSVVGRNGMGKTTLCKAIMGLTRASSGSIRVRGEEMLGLPPARVARHGVGYVPQGRRLWRSLTVDEHLRMTTARQSGAWTVERVYDAFPRLAERKNTSGAQLSGGEQQMLAISRALITNPRLLIMDEPTEGLAPVIVSQVEEMLVRLGEESDMAILVIEQNIGVATTVSENVAIMVNGRINRIIESRRLAADRELQQRLLGVGRHSDAEPDPADENGREAAAPLPSGARPAAAPVRFYVSNPTPPTRWSQPVPNARIEASARVASAGPARVEAIAEPRSARPAGRPVVLVVGTLDTKGAELRFIRDLVVASGLRARLVDVSTSGKLATCDVTAQEIALNHGRGGAAVFGRERGASVVRHGRGLRSLDQAPERHRRNHQCGRLGRRLDRRAGDARSPDRRAQGAGVVNRLRRRRPLRRPDGHHDDVFGHRRPGPERHLAAGAGERRAGAHRDGEGAPQRARGNRRGKSAPNDPSLGGTHHVRRHHALRAADHSRAGCGLGVPRLSRHRRRRPLHGEAGRTRGSSRRSSTSPPPKSPTC